MSIETMSMGDRIRKAAMAAEARYQEHQARQSEPEADEKEIPFDEEIGRILFDNDFFHGNTVDITKAERIEKLKIAAQWLDKNCWEIASTEIHESPDSSASISVVIEIRRLSSMKGKDKQVFAAMQILSDEIFMSGIKDEVICFTFSIHGNSK